MSMQFENNDEAVAKLRDVERDLGVAYDRKGRAEKEFLAAAAKLSRLQNEKNRILDHLADNFVLGLVP